MITSLYLSLKKNSLFRLLIENKIKNYTIALWQNKKQKSKNNKDDECENCRVRSGLPGTGQKSRHAYEQTVMVEGHIYS